MFGIVQATVTANRDDKPPPTWNVQMYCISADLVFDTSYVEQVREAAHVLRERPPARNGLKLIKGDLQRRLVPPASSYTPKKRPSDSWGPAWSPKYGRERGPVQHAG